MKKRREIKMPKWICEHCMKEARLTESDVEMLRYLATRPGNPVDKWDTNYAKYSTRTMEKNLHLGRTAFYTRVKKLTKLGLIELDTFRVKNVSGRYPVQTYRLTKEGKNIMGVK